jgi:hypothetical protein
MFVHHEQVVKLHVSKISLTTSNRSSISTVTIRAVMIPKVIRLLSSTPTALGDDTSHVRGRLPQWYCRRAVVVDPYYGIRIAFLFVLGSALQPMSPTWGRICHKRIQCPIYSFGDQPMGSSMRLFNLSLLGVSLLGATLAASPSMGAERVPPNDAPDTKVAVVPEPTESPRYLHDESKVTQGSITIAGRALGYQAEAGILVVHVKDPMDDDAPPPREDKNGPPPAQPPEAGMSYVAYFRGDKEDAHRPITFLFNGGPGSSTVWLHMGAFGPKRVVTADDTHSPAAPYRIVDNEYTLLDSTDLVFVDAPGTGFGHLRGTDKEKAFYGVDQDAHAFANFIVAFLSKHNRWNSPKYLFGESYGTTRRRRSRTFYRSKSLWTSTASFFCRRF